ncbi:MFS transporter [Streptomyces sp. NPDC008001]|uniref:MFS transporter n=1 Tax=Streptomyces sp. NPDC008001 TaxID=3364804 RepID=UPI0036EC87E8
MTNPAVPLRPKAERWDAEDPGFWERGGRHVARRNLLLAALCGHAGASVRSMWAVLVLFLPAGNGTAAGRGATSLLLVTPLLAGAALRPVAERALRRLGGRDRTVVATAALALPVLAAVYMLQRPGAPLWLLVAVAATAGAGESAAASATRTAALFPRRARGRAFAVATAGADLGAAAVQAAGVVAAIAAAGGSSWVWIAAVHVPLVALAAVVAALRMDNLPVADGAAASAGAGRSAFRDPQVWGLSLLSLATVGTFTGGGLAFGLVLRNGFGCPVPAALACALLATLLGAAARPCGGRLAGRWGAARVTLASLVGMAAGTVVLAAAAARGAVGVFAAVFTAVVVLAGLGAGAVGVLVPAVFAARAGAAILAGRDAATAFAASHEGTAKVSRLGGASGALGAAAIGASLTGSAAPALPALWGLLGFYALCVLITWPAYARKAAARVRGRGRPGPLIPYERG